MRKPTKTLWVCRECTEGGKNLIGRTTEEKAQDMCSFHRAYNSGCPVDCPGPVAYDLRKKA